MMENQKVWLLSNSVAKTHSGKLCNSMVLSNLEEISLLSNLWEDKIMAVIEEDFKKEETSETTMEIIHLEVIMVETNSNLQVMLTLKPQLSLLEVFLTTLLKKAFQTISAK
jgi:hypothetical protein